MAELKPLIAKIADGKPLSVEEAREAFDIIMSGNATPSQIGAVLMGLRVRGETVDEITGAVMTMREKMTRVSAPADAIDIVGTGGDASGTYNVSTCAALVAAGAGLHRRQARQPGAVVQVRRGGHAGRPWRQHRGKARHHLALHQ